MVCRTDPALKCRPAPLARLWNPDATAAMCSPSSRVSPADEATARPSVESNTACRTAGTAATVSSSSQPSSPPALVLGGIGPPGLQRALSAPVIDRSVVWVAGVCVSVLCRRRGGPGSGAGAATRPALLVRGHGRAGLLGRALGQVRVRVERGAGLLRVRPQSRREAGLLHPARQPAGRLRTRRRAQQRGFGRRSE